MNMRTRLIGLALAVSSMLVAAGPAGAAETATEDAYGGLAGAQQGGGDVSGATGGGSLPFTGAEITLIVVVALALIATGFVMRHLAKSRTQTI
jgi:hypothetical protein